MIPVYLAGAVGGGDWHRSASCPECGDTLERPDEGLVRCDCGQFCWVEIDGDGDADGWWNLFRVTRVEPPDSRYVDATLP